MKDHEIVRTLKKLFQVDELKDVLKSTPGIQTSISTTRSGRAKLHVLPLYANIDAIIYSFNHLTYVL